MKVLVALCVIALAQCGISSMEMSDDPGVLMMLSMKYEGKFELEGVLYQAFPRDGNGNGPTYVYAKAMSLGADLNGAVGFFGDVGDDCSAFDPTNTTAYNVTAFIQTLRENATDIQPIKYQFETTLFQDFNAKRFVAVVGGENFCGEFNVSVMGMKMLRMKYQACEKFDREGITELIANKLDLDKVLVQVGEYGNEDGCSYADIYFNADFDGDQILRKAYMGFGKKNQLGLYSPTEACMTNVKDTFIVDYILKRFLERTEEKEEPEMTPVKTCAGMSAAMVLQYQKRLREYDARVKAYTKAYGGSIMDEIEGSNQQQSVASACNCSAYGSEAMQMYADLKIISDYIGISLTNPEITMKQKALNALLAASYVNWEKVGVISEELRVLQETQDRNNWDVHVGTCMVAARPDSLKKMEEIKGRLQSAGPYNIEAEATAILRELFVDSILYSLDNIDKERELSLSLLRQKLQVIFGVTSSCSSESERKRVLGYLMGMTETLPGDIEQIAAMIENDNVTAELNALRDTLMENKETVAGTIFYFMYAPLDVEEDNVMYKRAKSLAMALKNNAEEIVAKAREWAQDETDNDKLMAIQVMLLTKADLDKGCDYSGLASKVRAMTAPVEEPAAPETPCSAAADQREQMGEYRRQRGGYQRRGGRREYNDEMDDEYYNRY